MTFWLPRLLALDARLTQILELGIGGLKKLVKVIPEHLDRRGITAVTTASAYTPKHAIMPGKGLAVDGLRAIRQPWRPGLLKSRRKLQIVDDVTGTQMTVTRPMKRKWSIESLSNASSAAPATNEGLQRGYGRYGFVPNRPLIARQLRQMPGAPAARSVTNEKVTEHAGGLPMIRRPQRAGARPG